MMEPMKNIETLPEMKQSVRPNCPHCGAKAEEGNIIKRGIDRGSQRFLCKACGRKFSLSVESKEFEQVKDDFLKKRMKDYNDFLAYAKGKDEETVELMMQLLSENSLLTKPEKQKSSKYSNRPDCPRCGAKAEEGYVQKRGIYNNGVIRYCCKSCNHYFTERTSSPLHGSRLSMDTWKKLISLTIQGKPILYCMEECNLSSQTVYNARVKILDTFKAYQKNL